MPIHCPVQIKCLDAAAFEALDYRVMGHAYASQNELGRLCDECAYKADLKARLLAEAYDNSIKGKGMNGRGIEMNLQGSQGTWGFYSQVTVFIPLPFIPLIYLICTLVIPREPHTTLV